MKLRINKTFVDRHTGEIYKVGQEVEFTKARAEEIIERVPDYVEKVVEKKPAAEKAEKKPAAKKAKKKEE